MTEITEKNESALQPTKRIQSIDRFRGFIVFAMIFFIGAADFPCLGILARVANNSTTGKIMLFDGMPLADLCEPGFLFLLSLSYQRSFDRRYEKSGKSAYLHFIMRYLTFIGIGSIIVSGEYLIIKKRPDPYLIQTFLMFSSLAGAVASGVMALIRKTPAKLKKAAWQIMTVSLFALAVIDIALGIRDDVVIFTDGSAELYMHWSILHEIGMTGLLMIPLIRLTLKGKIAAWFVIGGAYAAIQMIPGMVDKFGVIFLGGFAGTFGWLILMLGGCILIGLYDGKYRHLKYVSALSVVGVFTLFSCLYLPLWTRAVTVNYVLFALFASAALFFVLNLFDGWNPKICFFTWWGRNPMLLFLIGIVLRGAEKLWNPPPDTGLFVAILFTFGCTAALTVLAWYLYRKNITVKL